MINHCPKDTTEEHRKIMEDKREEQQPVPGQRRPDKVKKNPVKVPSGTPYHPNL